LFVLSQSIIGMIRIICEILLFSQLLLFPPWPTQCSWAGSCLHVFLCPRAPATFRLSGLWQLKDKLMVWSGLQVADQSTRYTIIILCRGVLFRVAHWLV